MTLAMDPAEHERMCAHVREGYPHEVVGLLAGDRESHRITRVHPLINERADSPQNRYRVSGLAVMRAEQALNAEGLAVVGTYHSHPDHPADYSEYDREHALPNMSYVIVSVLEGAVADVKSWRLSEDRSMMTPEAIDLSQEHPCP